METDRRLLRFGLSLGVLLPSLVLAGTVATKAGGKATTTMAVSGLAKPAEILIDTGD